MTDKDQAAPQGNEDAAAGRHAGPADPAAPAAADTRPVDVGGPEAAPGDPSLSAQARRSAPAWLAGVGTAEDSVPAEVQAKRERMAELAGQAEQLERAAKARMANRNRQVPAGAPKPAASGFFGQPGASAAAAEERVEERVEDRRAAETAAQADPGFTPSSRKAAAELEEPAPDAGPATSASPDEAAATSALPVAAAAPSNVPVVAHTPAPPPVAASTPETAGARRPRRSGSAAHAASSDAGSEAQRRSEAREAALAAKPLLARILQTLLAVAYPFLLLIGAIKLVASPWFLWLEYNRPGFPADAYGFSAGDRLTYGSYGVDYLNNAAAPDYLGNLVDLRGNPLFLNTEVAHMADVKAVIAATFAAGLILLAAAALIALYLSKRYAGGIRRALFAGAVSTIGLMVVLAVLGTLNWRAFFSGFHSVFFAEGTWTFSLDDTLIRLYPTQFWVDSAISVAGLVLLASAVTLILTWPTARRRERSRLRQEARDFGLNH